MKPTSLSYYEETVPGQTAYNRPDITNRVFKAKKDALIHNLRNGKYFNSKTAYILCVIEFQHRGLPHVHIVYRLENGPDHNDLQTCIDFIDQFLSTTMPIIDENSSEEDILYAKLVRENMIHKCFVGPNGCKDEETGECKRHFDGLPNIYTYLDEKKYPKYKRPNLDDCFIVAHNREMLLDCGCHVNTEFCASTYCIIYLYKYLYKGKKKQYILCSKNFF